MSDQPVLLQVDGPIARIVFNRPKVLNALSVAAADAFLAACKSVAADSGNRVVVIAGEGRAFMAGGDISAFEGPAEEVRVRVPTIMEPLHEGLEILAGLPQPVIASLQGAVAGAGMSIALSTDLAIAADNAIFTLAYSKLGTSPDGSSSWTLPRLVGLRKAMEIALLSDVYDAQEALRLGLVNRVVPAADLAMPDAFRERPDADPAAKAGFEGKPPSFRKEYLAWIADAKTDATRDKRIAEAMEWIAQGKGRFWKYQK